MRLLKIPDLQFEEFTGDDIPTYAILSHRWGNDEPSYWDMKTTIEQKNSSPPGKGPQWNKQGYRKIYQFSVVAWGAGYEYIWIDTCCIDKSSSAELQEAINSMYRWYSESDVCYAYLADVPTRPGSPLSQQWIKSFQASQWFTRGWTLQELLAPRDLRFFDQNWKPCGSRAELQNAIRIVTGIDEQSLIRTPDTEHSYLLSTRLGRIFSWAANRQTHRYEDRAYSLMGMLDVNMPLLYGEAERAFHRLQEEIIKANEDVSLLVWNYTDADTGFAPNGLARSPTQFWNYQSFIPEGSIKVPYVAFSPKMTARGLQSTLRIRKDPYEKNLGYAVLLYQQNQRSLVLPVLFCSLGFTRTQIRNECVRFSDPFWVPSWFIDEAKPKPLCFIRHVEAAQLYQPGDGLSLGPAVWENYIPTFTYPIQTQAGRRHFPAILGRLSTGQNEDIKDGTFIVELATRLDLKQRYVVIVDYSSDGTTVASNITITVAWFQRALNLPYAMKLVRRRHTRRHLKFCELLDECGKDIPRDDIIRVHRFTGLWVSEAENELDKPDARPHRGFETRSLGVIEAVYGLRR